MFTERIPGIGWRGADNGSSWEVDLINKFVEEATVRFQGVTTVTEGDWTRIAQQLYSKSGTASGGTTTRSESVSVSPPSGYGFYPIHGDRFVVQSTLTGNDGVTGGIGNPAEVRAQGQQKTTNSLLDGRQLEQRTPLTQIPSTANHYFNRQAGHGYHFLWRSFVSFSKQDDPTYNHTQNPSVNVDGGGSYTYIGTLEQGQASPLVVGNLTTELVNDQGNILTFGSGGSGRAFAWLEVKYTTRPEVITQPPQNVGPESVRMAGFLETDGYKDTTCGFEIRKAGVQQWDSHEAGVTESGSMFYVTLSGLDTIEDYQYRAWAENDNDKVYGSIQLFETESSPPVVSTLDVEGILYFEATLRGELLSTGGLETTCHFWWGLTTQDSNHSGVVDTFDPLNTGQFVWVLTGLDYDTVYYYHAYGVNAHNGQSAGNGEIKTFRTAYPHIAQPVNLLPLSGTRVEEVEPTFSFEFVEKTENPATKYHARIRFSLSSGMVPLIHEMESKDSQTGWEAFIGDEWVAFPSVGVDPEVPIRVTVQQELPFGPIYWDCAAWDGDRYGFGAKNRVDVYIPFEGIYGIYIGSPEDPTVQEEWVVLDHLNVVEASNGEIGSIDFNVHNNIVRPINWLQEGLSRAGGDPGDYLNDPSGLPATFELSQDDSYIGDGCYKITLHHTKVNGEFTPVGIYRNAHPGRSYTLSFYVKAANAMYFKMRLRQHGVGSTYFKTKTVTIEPDEWTRISISGELDQEYDGVSFEVNFGNIAVVTGSSFFVDGFMLEESPEPSLWELGGRTEFNSEGDDRIYHDYPAAQQIPYGAPVLLACRDQHGEVGEFQGWVRDKNPHGDIMQVSAILTDGILAERIVRKNYPAETPDTIEVLRGVKYEGADATEAEVAGHSLDGDDVVVISDTANYDGAYSITALDQAMSFSGDYIGMPAMSNFTAFTVEGWFKADVINTEMRAVALNEQSPYILIRYNSSNDGQLSALVFDGAVKEVFVDTGNVDITEWHHVAVTAAQDGDIIVYVNGTNEGSLAVGTFQTTDTPGNSIAVSRGKNSHAFTGQIKQVRVWDSVKSATDINSAIYDRLAGDEADLVACWDLTDTFVDSATTYTPDKTGNYDGTVFNSPSIVKATDNLYLPVEFEAAEGGGVAEVLGIGETIRQIVDEYCAPIITDSIDTTIDYRVPVEAKNKTVLQVVENLRRQFGFFYFVDRINDMHLYMPDDIVTPSPIITLRRGEA